MEQKIEKKFGGILNRNKKISPARVYLDGIQKETSKKTISSHIKNISILLGYTNADEVPWSEVRKEHVLEMISISRKQGKSPATVNTLLSVIKGVMKTCWEMGEIPFEEFYKIEKISSLKVNNELKGRELSSNEIFSMLDYLVNKGDAASIREAV